MNETHEELLEISKEILNVKKNFDPRVFSENGKIHNLLRQRLLHRAHYMAQETIGSTKGLEVGDIVLLGSSASYFYRPASDLDVKIEIINKSCPYLPAFKECEDGFTKYLSSLTSSFFSNHQKFFIGKRFLDIKLAPKVWDYAWTGIYSLIDNKWLILPRKDIAKDFTAETLVQYYYVRCQEIDDFVNSLPKSGEKYSQEQCNKMFYYYKTQVLDRNQTIEDYLAFKIIKATGKLKELGAWVFNNQLKTLEF